MRCEEARELITALVDDELWGAERSAVESHLSECRSCAFAYEEELALKKRVRSAAAELRAPAHLRERILVGPRIFSGKAKLRGGWKELWPAAGMFLRPALALALLVLLVLPILYFLRPVEQSVPLLALQIHTKIVEGQFRPMEHHFSVKNLEAAGWWVHEVGGQKLLVMIYEKNGSLLSCHTFLGAGEGDVPANAEVFFDPAKRINLYAFSKGRINGIIRREGDATCVLVSDMPMTHLLALARSKA